MPLFPNTCLGLGGKNRKNKTLLGVMDWIDAIVFALVAVYFINIYLFQNYQIPSSSLEKSLMVGDFLFVSKASFGPRVPNTPLSFPLAQHTLPILNCKSFIENPQWSYRRLKGLDELKRDDIVVFNFPTGMCLKLLRDGDLGSRAKNTRNSLISSESICSGSLPKWTTSKAMRRI